MKKKAVQRGANYQRAETDGAGPQGRGPGGRRGRERMHFVRLKEQVHPGASLGRNRNSVYGSLVWVATDVGRQRRRGLHRL